MNDIIISGIAAVGTMVASYFSYKANQSAKQGKVVSDEINQAVNFRGGKPRLYDLVWSNFNRVDTLEKGMADLKKDIKKLTHVVSVHEVAIDKVQEQIEE